MKIYSYLKLTFLYLISIVKIRKVIRIQTKFEYCANSTFTQTKILKPFRYTTNKKKIYFQFSWQLDAQDISYLSAYIA